MACLSCNHHAWNCRIHHESADALWRSRGMQDARDAAAREFLYQRHLVRRIPRRLRWLDGDQEFLRRRDAAANERGDVHLVFSGRYRTGHPAVKQPRLTRGAPIWLALYENDPNFLTRLNGMFHGLLVDRARGTATLFNDRYGMHRIYYHEAKDAFYFAAEAKAILAVLPELRDRRSAGAGRIRLLQLRPGESHHLQKHSHPAGRIRAGIFRTVPSRKRTPTSIPRNGRTRSRSKPNLLRELRDVFSRNLPRYFNGRQQVGMTLTGGLDTRVIMAWHKPAPAFASLLHVWRHVP